VDTQVRAKGRGLEVDKDRTLLVTESCLINLNRNLGINKTEVEVQLKSTLRVNKVI
jgi:agmatine deiminase